MRPSRCSLSVQFQTSGTARSSRPASAASCHSSSVGSRAPTEAAYDRASARSRPVAGAAGSPSRPSSAFDTSRTRDRDPRGRGRRVRHLDEVVQARRQGLPLLDVGRLAVRAGLAPPEDRRRRRSRRRRLHEARRDLGPRRERCGDALRQARRKDGRLVARRGDHALAVDVRRDAARRDLDREAGSREAAGERLVAPVRDRPERRPAVRPARRDDGRRDTARMARQRRPLAVARSGPKRRWTTRMARSTALSRSLQPTQSRRRSPRPARRCR